MLGQDKCICGTGYICPAHVGSHTSTNEVREKFTGGTIRSTRKPPYHLVPKELLEAVAWTRFDGDSKYEPSNWMKGDKQFFVDCLNHAIDHLYDFAWDDSEDHLGHCATNIAFILWAMARGKVSKQDFQEVATVFKEIREERMRVIK